MAREHTLHEMPLAESASSGSGTTFTRLAKLLHQSSTLAGRSNLQPPPTADNAVQSLGRGLGLGLGEEAPRRLSWERCVYVIYGIYPDNAVNFHLDSTLTA
ncbi:GD15175 [Drosophila simulans]|uniref:GD15175 n=1 Tax=Drosophila simulans TaxID=7240 RepID=B4NTF1_DROSI|nr:GD15175 [Drosophila simulans]